MRDYTSLHRFAYIRYLTNWLQENRDQFWPVLNTTAEKWSRADSHMSFHAYVIEHGLTGTDLLPFSEFMKTAYHDPKVAGPLFLAVEDMQLWVDEHGTDFPENFVGF